MKVIILAGGLGTRLSEETDVKPKPMVEIGGHPILWHIMMHYSTYNYNNFVIALGYKGEMIKKYMMEYNIINANMTVRPQRGEVEYHSGFRSEWTVELIDTGQWTNTGGRIKRLRQYIGDERFFMTWGDGVSDVNLNQLLEFHKSHGKLCTVTAVRPPARFGHMEFEGNLVRSFTEKPQTSEGWINGAFFVCEPGIFDYIQDDMTQWEREPMETLAAEGNLVAYKHDQFWACMDTLRDKRRLEELWTTAQAPWKIWKD
jgi:glucose-1-phosphate cytidylyltransferase